MEWHDSGIVLATYPQGETSLVLEVLAEFHGKQRGLLKGVKRSKNVGSFDIGNILSLRWRGRLENQLGYFTAESAHHTTAGIFFDSGRLLLISCVCQLLHLLLADADDATAIFHHTRTFFDAIASTTYQQAYVQWEWTLLSLLGYGLDTSCCVVSGDSDDLRYISPKSWHAVSATAGAPYKHLLLPLPAFIINGHAPATPGDIADGLRTATYFLDKVFQEHKKTMPMVRTTLTFLA